MIKYELKSKFLVTQDEREQLDELHYSDGHCFREFSNKSKLGIVILAKNNNKIVAWSLIFDRDIEITYFTFVSKKYRRRGIGGELFNIAKTNFGNHIAVSRHNSVAQKFYDAIGA